MKLKDNLLNIYVKTNKIHNFSSAIQGLGDRRKMSKTLFRSKDYHPNILIPDMIRQKCS